jgi:ADP-heptose:LPS heptosyltransferase
VLDRPLRIAVLRALHLGDLLLAVPALRALRAGFPNAEITLISLPWAAELVRRFPAYLDRFVELPGFPGLVEPAASPERRNGFLAQQRARRYDLAIQLHGSGRLSNRLALALGAPSTVGYYEGARPARLTLAAPYPEHLHEIQRNLRLVRLLGGPDLGEQLEFPLSPADRRQADALLGPLRAGPGPLVGLHPGAKWATRRWPLEYYAALGCALRERREARLVLTGGPGEGELTARLAAMLGPPVLDLGARTPLGTLAAVIARLDLFISNDTGPAHLAVALDRPSVTLFGPGDWPRWAPRDPARHASPRRPVPCSPCFFETCPIDHGCLRGLLPEAILPQAERLLDTSGVARAAS